MINDDITRQIAADYARLLTSTPAGFDLTLAEAIDSDLLPEDVLEQLCEMFGSNRKKQVPDGGMSMGVANKNSLLSRFQNIFNKRREQGVHGAAAQSSALKPLNRRVIASQAKLGDAAGQETIRRDINKTGLKDKLRAAGLGTKVRVRVDKETGHYHVTDASGKKHVIESRNTVPRGPDHPDSAIGRLKLYRAKAPGGKGITMSPKTRAGAVAAEKAIGNPDFLPKRQRAALYKKWNDSHRQFVRDANSRTDASGKPLDPYDNNDS